MERLKNFEKFDDSEKIVSIMMDEMRVRSGLVFNRYSGRLVGFVNLGDTNSDLEAMQSSLAGQLETEVPMCKVATSMLVLMVCLLRDHHLCFPWPSIHHQVYLEKNCIRCN